MSVDEDAREFGQHFKQGGWRLGLLVARNVEPHKGQGKPRPRVDEVAPMQDLPVTEKVSASAFAEKAGVSKQNVAYYYKAWQLAANDGNCPHAETLAPDDEVLDDIEEDDQHTREMWSKYLQKAKEPREPKDSNANGSCQGPQAASDPGSRSETRVSQAVEALAKTSEQLSEKLVKVVNVTPLQGEDEELAQFAEELRRTRFALDGYCREIDRVLQRIGFGDTES